MDTSLKPATQYTRTDPTVAGAGGDFQIPWDLTEIVEAKSLVAWVREEISGLHWDNPELVEYLRAHPNYHPRMLLTVLTYAYASGVFESEEILRRCDTEPVYRALSTDAAPESISAIRKFRRDNRALLKWGLIQSLKRCLEYTSNLNQGQMLLPAGVKRLLLDNAVARLELARHLDRAMQEI